jgi:hypothetical protein
MCIPSATPTGQGWVNKVNGEVTSRHRTQDAAAEAGRRQARRNESEHVIHGRDGRIREKNSYGNDPNPPKDRR